MSFTTNKYSQEFTRLDGIKDPSNPTQYLPLHYSAVFSNGPNGPKINELDLKTNSGHITYKHGQDNDLIDFANSSGKALAQVRFDANGKVSVFAPDSTGNMAKADAATAKRILQITKDVFDHKAFEFASKDASTKAGVDLSGAISTASHNVGEALKSPELALAGMQSDRQARHYGTMRMANIDSPQPTAGAAKPTDQQVTQTQPPRSFANFGMG